MSENSFRFIIVAVIVIWIVLVLIPAGIDAFPRVWATVQYFIPGDSPIVVVTVKDARSGDSVVDARVQIVGGDSVISAATDKQGQATFESVPAGYGRTVRIQKLDYDIEVISSAVIPRRQRAAFRVAVEFDPYQRLWVANTAGTGMIDISMLDQASRLLLNPPGPSMRWQSIPAVDMRVSNSTQRAYIMAPDRVSAVNVNDGDVVRDLFIDPPAGGIALGPNSDVLYIFSGGPRGEFTFEPPASPTALPTVSPRSQTPSPLVRPTARPTPSPTPVPVIRGQQARSVIVLDTHTWGVRHIIEMVSAADKAVLLPSRDGQRLYMAGIGEQNIYVFETKQYQRQAIYRPGGRIKDMTLDRDGRVLYVLLEGRPAPVAVDVVGTSGVSAVVDAGPAAELAGATRILYADSSLYKWLCLMDPGSDKIWLVDLTPSDARSRTINAVAVGDNPSAMLQLPASDKLLVANKGASTLSVVSMSSRSVEDTVDVHSNPVILALP